jgi:hypothetical protein
MKTWVLVLTTVAFLVPTSGKVMAGAGSPGFSNDPGKVSVLSTQGRWGWLPAVSLGDTINSPYWDYSPSLTGEGNHLIFASDRPGGYGERDLWEADRDSGGVWHTPVNLGPVINSAHEDQDPWISPEDDLLVFSSDRPGGYGAYDLWMSRKVGGVWQTPVNMGDVINFSNWDSNTWISPDTLRLYYGSYYRPGGYGDWDMWMSTKSGGVWGPPVNMGPNINTSAADGDPSLTPDEQTLYLTARNRRNDSDIFVSRKVGGVWQPRENVGPNVNSPYNEDRVWITAGELPRLYFCSDRRGGSGSMDLYYSVWGDVGTEEKPFPVEENKFLVGSPKPNPSTRMVSISLELPARMDIEASVYSLAGERVKLLIRGSFSAGRHVLAWDERDQKGGKAASGIYFFRIRAGKVKTDRQFTVLQ